ncbi:unnamed protein product [Victoria cruziana]
MIFSGLDLRSWHRRITVVSCVSVCDWSYGKPSVLPLFSPIVVPSSVWNGGGGEGFRLLTERKVHRQCAERLVRYCENGQ